MVAFVSRFSPKNPVVRAVEGRREAVLGEARARVVTGGAGGWRWSIGSGMRVARPPRWPGNGGNGEPTATGRPSSGQTGPVRAPSGRTAFFRALGRISLNGSGQWPVVSGQREPGARRRPGARRLRRFSGQEPRASGQGVVTAAGQWLPAGDQESGETGGADLVRTYLVGSR